MAIVIGPRLGLKTYTSGSDARPGRAEHNTRTTILETYTVVGAQGPESDRPTAGKGLALFYNQDRKILQWDTGTAWQDLSVVGGGGTPTAVRIGGTATEGSSERGARADHTHTIPQATSTVAGAMPAADKAKLDAASTQGIAGRLMLRDSAGRAQIATPTAAADIANKTYVDNAIQTAGVGPVTTEVSGMATPAMLAATNRVDEATTAATPNTLALRDTAARITIGTPTSAGHASTKGYVDAAINSHRHDAAHINAGVLSPARIPVVNDTAHGAMSTTDKNKLDAASAAATPNTLVMLDPNGRAQFNTPSMGNDAANKTYVDNQINTRAPGAHNHSAAQITAGTLAAARLPQVTSTTAGAMGAADKTKLDAATNLLHNGTLVSRDPLNGTINIGTPTDNTHATTKNYVDTALASKSGTNHTHDARDINSGTINVSRLPVAGATTSGIITSAEYNLINNATNLPTANTIATRGTYSTLQVETGTNAKDAANKGYVDDTIANAGNTGAWPGLMARDANANASIADPTASVHIANKRYVDSKTWDGSDINRGIIPWERIQGSTWAYNTAQSGSVYTVSVNSIGRLMRFTSRRADKDNITDLDVDPRRLLAINPVAYNRRDPDTGEVPDGARTEWGVIVEEEYPRVPELVMTEPDPETGEPVPESWDVPGHVAAHQHILKWLSERIDGIEAQINRQED